MRRRQILLGALAAPWAARGRAAPRTPPFRIGLLGEVPELTSMLREAFAAAGMRDGREYTFVGTGAGYGDPPEPGARRLVAAGVDLILVPSTAHALAAFAETRRIPIVMWSSGYPVEAGLARSLSQPGGNVTGVTHYAGTGIWGKLLELLRESRGGLKRAAVLWGYVPPAFPRAEIEPCYRELREAAQKLALSLRIEEVAAPDRLRGAIEAIDAVPAEGLLITAGPGFHAQRHEVMAYAERRRMATVADYHWPGGDDAARPLLSYGGSFRDSMLRAAQYAARILLHGAKPGGLPIQQPAKFELIVNLRSARAIGLELPRALMVRADRVIE